MPVELFIALRYLKARRNGVFTLLTTVIAVGGISLGVAALIITLAVMSGFQTDIRNKILGLSPHIILIKNGSFGEYNVIQNLIRQDKNISATSPFCYGQVIIKNKTFTTGAVLKGIKWEQEQNIVSLRDVVDMKEEIGNRKKDIKLNTGEIIIGKELSVNLGAVRGDEIVVMSPGQALTTPKMKKFKIKAVFHSGMYEYDSTIAYVPIEDSQNLFDMGDSVTGIGIKINNPDNAGLVEKQLSKTISFPYVMRTWQMMNKNLFAALKLEKIMMFIILALIIIVAAFNVISNLLLLTVEKAGEIGILTALGMSRKKIAKIFFYEGAIVGFSGILIGSSLGITLSLLLKKYQFINLPADVYYLDTLPVKIIYSDIFTVVLVTTLITLVSIVYPSYQASKLDPIQSIRSGQ